MVAATGAAGAATPLISGKYVWQQQQVCAALLSQSTNNQGYVTNVGTSYAGTASIQTGQLTFNSTAGTVNGTATQQSTGGIVRGVGETLTPTDTPENLSATFTNTSSTLTIVTSSGTQTFHAIYGTLKKNVAQFVALSELSSDASGAPCVNQGSLTID
jgi:3-deoxy-D-manno-octulosonic-acid transferase